VQAKTLLAAVRPRDATGRTRGSWPVSLIAEIGVLTGKLKLLGTGSIKPRP